MCVLAWNQIKINQKVWFKTKKSRYSLAMLMDKLRQKDSEEAIFALQMIESLYQENLLPALECALRFPSAVVKIFALKKVEEYKFYALQDVVEQLVKDSKEKKIVRNSALITLFGLDKIISVLDLEMGYLYGLLRYGQSHKQRVEALQLTQELLKSPNDNYVIFAINLIAEFRLSELYELILPLFSAAPTLKLSAIKAASVIGHYPPFVPYLLKEIEGEVAFRQAIDALANFGESALQSIRAEFGRTEDPTYLSRLIRVCSKMPGKSEGFLLGLLGLKNLQTQVINALKVLDFKAKSGLETKLLVDEIEAQIFFSYTLLRSAIVLDLKRPKYDLLVQAILSEYELRLSNLADLLCFLVPSQKKAPTENREAYIEAILPKCSSLSFIVKKKLTLLVADTPLNKKTEELSDFYHFPLSSEIEIISYIIKEDSRFSPFGSWTKTVALESLETIESTYFLKQTLTLLESKNIFLKRAALHLLEKTAKSKNMNIQEFLEQIAVVPKIKKLTENKYSAQQLLDIEKVIILKRTELFSQTPENTLIDIVRLTKEVSFKKDETIFEKGMPGDCMYVIYEGRVKIHVGGFTLTTLINGDFFGELGLLDTGQRTANATCEADTLLLRIDQEDFYELTGSRPEVAKGVIKALCEIIRNQSISIENLKSLSAKSVS